MGSTRPNAAPVRRDGYDRRSGAYHAAFDPTSGDSPSVAVVRAVSAITGVAPSELEPLSESVDPDGLNGLITDGPDDPDAGIEVRFTFHDHLVVVHDAGEVAIYPPRPPASAESPPPDDQ